MATKTIADLRAEQTPNTRRLKFANLMSTIADIGRSQRTSSKAKLENVEPPTSEPGQTLVIPNLYDESSSHTPMDDDSSQSSFLIRLPPRRTVQTELSNKETRTRRPSRQNAEAKDRPKKVDGAPSKPPAESTKAPSRKSSTRSSRRASASEDSFEERLMKALDDRIQDVHALEAAHREFYESKVEDLVYQRTQTLKNNFYHEIDELQWALMRSEEANRVLETNQVRMVAVIDDMQNQLQELRYELGYGATDTTLSTKRKRGALCAELFPDQYAELNPSERPAWTRKDSKNREPFGAWRENPDEKCHRPATLEEPCKYKADGLGNHLPMLTLSKSPVPPHDPELARGVASDRRDRKRRRGDDTPSEEADTYSEWSEQSGYIVTAETETRRAVKRPRQWVESLCDFNPDDLAMKQ